MGAPAWAVGNNFSGDPNVVMLQKFDTGAANGAYYDYSGKGNHLYYNQGGIDLDLVNMVEGDGCGDFEIDDSDFLSTPDANLPADFPAKSGTSNPVFSVTGWFNPEAETDNLTLVAKYNHSTNKRNWGIMSFGTSEYVWVEWGYSSGSSVRQYNCSVTDGIKAGQWYFFHIVFDDPNNVCNIRVYDNTESKWTSSNNAPTDAMNCEDSALYMGRQGGGNYYDGKLDDVAIFDKVLTAVDANSIVAGSFDYDADPNCLAHYAFDTTGLGYDDQEYSHMLSATVPGFAGPRDDIKCILATDAVESFVGVPDATLSSKFPGKNGQANEVITVCYWFKPFDLDDGSNSAHVVGKGTGSSGIFLGGWTHDIDEPKVGYISSDIAGTSHPIVSQSWYHITGIIDKPNTRIYVSLYDPNGTTYTAENLSGSGTFTTAEPFKVGSIYTENSCFDGYLGELVVFDKALTAAEIIEVRDGTYAVADTGTSNWWWRRRHNN